MFCTNCGANRIEANANYCYHCGKPLSKPDDPKAKKLKRLQYLLPLLSFILVIIILYTTKLYEMKVNAKVIAFQEKGEEAALAGEFDKALRYIENGLSYRNDYEILIQDKEMILVIKELKEELDAVEKKIMNEQFAAAKSEINVLKNQVDQSNQSPLFISLSQDIQQVETSVTVGEIKEEINKLTTIDELAAKLSTLYTLELSEASELKQQIYTKMVTISATEAEKRLEDKHFNQAVRVIEEALEYVVNNEKLLSLKERVIAEKTSFEKAEQERIEKAMLAAKKEEERNLTKAVQLTTSKVNVDKYGDAYINGKVKNSGTETVHSIVIEFNVLDENGKKLESGKTNVFPNKLEPGQSGDFEHVTYSVKENAKVEITNISWLLEEKKG
ncbi:FxLYD domain-containing protein [uncultured Metabacillus sp.]|uniref:FxLYD domain-containing protein n=1 Tax=uncultured Metabacillus sp. TaxID=2860135 RepID=UPI0026086099|nr:FxLYD domain-containing protein [uncultured Metabacillus sp.]